MTEEKCVVTLSREYLVFFFGVINDEIVGIVSYVVRTPEHSHISSPKEPAR